MKKRLLILPLLAGFALSSCSFEDLMFWKKKGEEQSEVPGGDPSGGDPSGGDPSETKAWPTTVQNLMKQHLDNLVLPYIEGTWTWIWDTEFEVIYGTSYDTTLAKAKAAFSTWEDLGQDSDGDIWYGKQTANGSVELVPYNDTDDNKKAFVAIEASFKAPKTDWSDAEKALMTETLGVVVPFVTGEWDPLEEEDGIIGSYGDSVDMTAAKNALEKDEYTVDYDSESDSITAYLITSTSKITVELYSFYGLYVLEMSKMDKLTQWPAEEVATYVGHYMDFEVEVVPAVSNATAYFVSESSNGLNVECVGVTASTYVDSLAGEHNWVVSDNYLQSEGLYVCTSPNETIGMYVYPGEGSFKLDITPILPTLSSWPATYLNAFVKNEIGSIFTVPALEGKTAYTYNEIEYYVSQDSQETILVAEITVGSTNIAEADLSAYFNLLKSNGYDGSYSESTEQTYANFTVTRGKIIVQGRFIDNEGQECVELSIYGADVEESPIVVEDKDIKLIVGGEAQIEASLLDGFSETISYESKNTEVATVTSEGLITASAKGSANIEVSVVIDDVKYVQTVSVTVLEQATSVSIEGASEVKVGKTSTYNVAFPEGTHSSEKPVWSITSGGDYATIDSDTGVLTAASDLTSDQEVVVSVTVGELSNTKTVTIKNVVEITDTLTLTKLGVPTGTVYKPFSGIKDNSSAVYAGTCAGDGGTIQIRSKNRDAGIYSSTSGGTIVSVSVTFNATKDKNTSVLNVVASNEPFTSVESLHTAQVIGTISNVNGSGTYEFTSSYAYVGLVSSSNAHYLDSVSFVWSN